MIYLKGTIGILAMFFTIELFAPVQTYNEKIAKLENEIIVEKAILESYKK